jgi:LCP family protein required for cell wall assembly
MSEAENVDEFLGQPINILFLGSDSRSGDNVYFAGDDEVEGARADAAIIMHISADRESMAMVSIPRDTIIDIPACPTTTPGRFTNSMSGRRFNEAFAVGYDNGGDILSAAICALTTVEQITNIHLDGFIVLDFLGFTQMVDALGGVGLNVETYIHAPKAGGLHLEPGFQTISGDQALQFARARVGRGLGDGSDLSRIARQQQLLSAIATEALAQNVITDFPRFLRFLDATTSHMTASHNFATVQGLTSLATSLRGVDFENIEFLTAPIKANPADHNTLVFAPDAAELWQVLRYDTFAVSQFASVPDDDSLESAEVSLEAAG